MISSSAAVLSCTSFFYLRKDIVYILYLQELKNLSFLNKNELSWSHPPIDQTFLSLINTNDLATIAVATHRNDEKAKTVPKQKLKIFPQKLSGSIPALSVFMRNLGRLGSIDSQISKTTSIQCCNCNRHRNTVARVTPQERGETLSGKTSTERIAEALQAAMNCRAINPEATG